MSVDTNNTELKKGADLATIADQRDDQRQQAEAEAAQEVLQRMQDTAAEDEKRRAHEEAEAKRKAEWEQKQREKAEAEQAAWENAVAMGDDEVMMASMKRVGDDAERLTRRNMKQCVTEHIQTKCLSEPEFARQVIRHHIFHIIAFLNPTVYPVYNKGVPQGMDRWCVLWIVAIRGLSPKELKPSTHIGFSNGLLNISCRKEPLSLWKALFNKRIIIPAHFQ